MWLVGTVEGAIKYPDDSFMIASPTGQRKFLFVDLLHPSQIIGANPTCSFKRGRWKMRKKIAKMINNS
eukprot:11807578-Prorocentrum_lima.AAC.1